MFHRSHFLLAGLALAAPLCAQAAAPVFPAAPGGDDFPTSVPCGKTLVIPVAVDDPDGDTVSLTVTSSSPKVMARVRSGNFHYKVHVESADDGSTTGTPVPFAGDMEFQLFRHATPETAAFIAGFAQSGYYDDVKFHRVIPDFVIQGGDPAGTGSGQSPYTIRHEFRPELIYSGRGQLAMANSEDGYHQSFPSAGNFRYRTGSFAPTNGSQFFVTLGQPRHLDFKHTLFGQLVRGYPTLDRIASVKTATVDNRPNTPVTAVEMTQHTVTASRTDATLLLSATDTVNATITITARDSTGASATKTISVSGVVDTTNNPPMLLPFESTVAPVGTLPGIQVRAFDLEHDAISTRFPVQDIFSGGSVIYAGLNASNLSIVAPTDPGAWDIAIGVSGLNDPLLDINPFFASRFETLEIGVGDRAVLAKPRTVEAEAAASTGQVVLASFRHGSAASSPGDYIAIVNWGDGSALQSTEGTNPPITVVRSATEPGGFEVRGQHTYARSGVYPLHVIVDAPSGATDTARGWASVSPANAVLRAAGEEIIYSGANFTGRPLAYFRDSTPGAKAADYSVVIDWGDGQRTPGTARQVGIGRFAVMGTHRYVDPENFSTAVHIKRNNTSDEAVAWGRIQLTGFRGPQHLPPFSKASITALWAEDPLKVYRGAATDITASLFILNGGDKATGKWKLRFWISDNKTLETTATPPATADKPVKLGPLNRQLKELALSSLPPGAGGSLALKPVQGGDFTLRLPAGETGAGKYLLAELDYSDPIADKMPVAKVIPFGPLTGIITKRATPFIVREDGANNQGSTTFTVKLDTLPTADVTIPLDIAINGTADTTRAELSASQLVFTPQNGTTEQTVTVTAKDDKLLNSSNTVTIRLKAATSTDLRFKDMDATDVTLGITDFPRNVVVTPLTMSIQEGTASKTFTVRLQTLPSGNVNIPLEIVNADGNPDTTRATIDKTVLNFTTSNGTTAQTVTVSAVNDDLVNGSANYTIRVLPAVGSDTGDAPYGGRDGGDVALTITDNDVRGFDVSSTTITAAENDAARTFTVKLKTKPSSNVTIPIEIVNQGGNPDNSRATLNVTELVFTPENATTAQTVVITPVNDAVANGDALFTIKLKPAIQEGGDTTDYHDRDPADVSLGIVDDDDAE